jgi:hypothetical protein
MLFFAFWGCRPERNRLDSAPDSFIAGDRSGEFCSSFAFERPNIIEKTASTCYFYKVFLFGIRPIFRVTKRRLSICVSENKL